MKHLSKTGREKIERQLRKDFMRVWHIDETKYTVETFEYDDDEITVYVSFIAENKKRVDFNDIFFDKESFEVMECTIELR